MVNVKGNPFLPLLVILALALPIMPVGAEDESLSITGDIVTLWCEDNTGDYPSMTVTPVDDLDGDGNDDVLVKTWALIDNQWTITLIAKKGTNGVHLWQESFANENGDAWIYAQEVSDLDGDGNPDVLVGIQLGPYDNRTATLIAKKGNNGSHLWQESITGENAEIYPSMIDDIDGDGRYDVLVVKYAGTEFNRTSTLIAVNGSNGSHLWQESVNGENAVIYAEKAGDLDNDGKPDALVMMQVGPVNNITATVIAKTGNNGSHLWEENITGEGAGAIAERAGDLDGDGMEDVLVRTNVGPQANRTATLIAKKGNDGSHLWQEGVTGDNAWIYKDVINDLHGDGKPDVLVSTYTGPQNNRAATLMAVKGDDGSHLWQESISGEDAWIYEDVVNDLDDDGRPDILVGFYTGPLDNRTATLIAKKGNNGSHLWEESVSGAYAGIWGTSVGDLDGDGGIEVLVMIGAGSPDNQTVTLIAKKGSDGSHLWEEGISGENAWIYTEMAGDLDGDGNPDVLVMMQKGSLDTTSTLIAKKGNNGSHLWQESISGEKASIAGTSAGDLDGDGNIDALVLSWIGPDDNRTAEIIAKRGMNGSHLWQESLTCENANVQAYLPGDLDCDGNPDVLVYTYVETAIAEPGELMGRESDETILDSRQLIDRESSDDALFKPELKNWLTQSDKPVAVGNIDYDYKEQLIAKKGSNGAHLWQVEAIGGLGFSIQVWSLLGSHKLDLNGDGSRDIVVWIGSKTCALASPTCEGEEWPTLTHESSPKKVSPSMPGQLTQPLLSLQYLNVTPQKISAGQPVTIAANVVNTGDQAGNYNVALKINGKVELTMMASVGPHGTQPVKFIVTKSQPGTYTVDIGEKRGSFVVLGADNRADNKTSGSHSGDILLAVLGSVILAMTIIVIMMLSRRRA